MATVGEDSSLFWEFCFAVREEEKWKVAGGGVFWLVCFFVF